MAGFTLNPALTTTAAGTFNVESSGFIQGFEMDDPAIRNQLCGGTVALTEPPMYGGLAVTEVIPTGYVTGTAAGPKALGPTISRANSVAGTLPITAFTSSNQLHSAVATPQSPVAMAAGGMSIHFYRVGSRARIPLAIDPALITLQGGLVTQQVSWDFAGQRIVPFVAAYAANAVTAATYNNATGVATYTTATAHGLVAGNDASFSGITPTGYNGSFTTATGTTGSTINVQMAPGLNNAGAMPAATAFGTLVAGGGPLPGRILEVASNNCMTVNVDPVSGFATWNRNGACALVLI